MLHGILFMKINLKYIHSFYEYHVRYCMTCHTSQQCWGDDFPPHAVSSDASTCSALQTEQEVFSLSSNLAAFIFSMIGSVCSLRHSVLFLYLLLYYYQRVCVCGCVRVRAHVCMRVHDVRALSLYTHGSQRKKLSPIFFLADFKSVCSHFTCRMFAQHL